MFKNREEAGELLAQELIQFRKDPSAILLALPRGGVAVAYQLSLALHLALDVLITRKIGAPGNPEYALAAVSETRRVALYRQGRPFPDLNDRTVILVDDGLATGATFFASVATARQGNPRRVIGAIPVGPRSTVEEARKLVDQLIVLRIPDPFYAVGNFYRDFEQVEDREVLQYLNLAEEASINRS